MPFINVLREVVRTRPLVQDRLSLLAYVFNGCQDVCAASILGPDYAHHERLCLETGT